MLDVRIGRPSGRGSGGAARPGQCKGAARGHGRAFCAEALTWVAGQMIQLHGAIGITWEHAAYRYFKRAHGAGQFLGRAAERIARIAAAVIGG
jgi:alkylation response protein AidB-like acyl-CoA dehydrogenase